MKFLRQIILNGKNWLEKDINFNTQKRKQQKNDFEKDL